MQYIVMLIAGNERGGAASHIVTLAKAVKKYSTDPHFVFVSIGRGPLHDSLMETGVEVRLLEGSLSTVLSNLKRILRELPDSILHSHGPRMNVIASFVAKWAKRPWTSTIHSNPNLDFLSSRLKTVFFTRLHRLRLASAVGLFVGNPTFADLVPVKTVVFVPNALWLPNLPESKAYYESKLKRRSGIPEASTIVGIAARLDPVKDIQTLIKAMVHIPDESVHLAIAGDGAEKENLIQFVHRLGLEQRIHFLGFVDNVFEFYAGLSIHILTSVSEGASPFCLLEAGSVGVPNIGTKIPGIMNLLENDVTGLCFDVGDDKELARMIEEVLHDPELSKRIAFGFTDNVLPKYQPKKMLDAYLRGYKMFSLKSSF